MKKWLTGSLRNLTKLVRKTSKAAVEQAPITHQRRGRGSIAYVTKMMKSTYQSKNSRVHKPMLSATKPEIIWRGNHVRCGNLRSEHVSDSKLYLLKNKDLPRRVEMFYFTSLIFAGGFAVDFFVFPSTQSTSLLSSSATGVWTKSRVTRPTSGGAQNVDESKRFHQKPWKETNFAKMAGFCATKTTTEQQKLRCGDGDKVKCEKCAYFCIFVL